MKIVIAVDSYKDSMSAITATHVIAQGISRISPNTEIVSCPIADGGEGTVDTFLAATDGLRQHDYVTGPLGESQKANN
jgi:glycerate kinase